MRVAIVVPRYGAEVVGGAEAQARDFAMAARQRGWSVEVWTNLYRRALTLCQSFLCESFP